jgi:hypothetical protein
MTEKEVPFNSNQNRDIVECCIEVSRFSKLPFLLLGNPGIAKTTCIENWAKRNGYFVESLVGSRHSQEEILGYMVKVNDGELDENLLSRRIEHIREFAPKGLSDEAITNIALNTMNNDRLETLTPDWYNRVMAMKAKGIPSVLFLDEISGCPENVQASLLTLIFDRVVGNGSKLPDDCIVIGAANYKGNLGGVFTIIPPALNRFVIMNLEFDGIDNLVGEFLQDPADMNANLVAFADAPVNEQTESDARALVKDMMLRVFGNYATPGGDQTGVLNLKNQNFSEMYDNDGNPVYNFISGRSISYLARVATAIYHFDLGKKIYGKFVDGCCLGLIGLGTNTFANEKQAAEYRNSVVKLFHKVVKDLKNKSKGATVINKTLDYTGKEVDAAINEWTLYNEQAGAANFDDNLARLYNYVYEKYNTTADNMRVVLEFLEKEPAKFGQFINDLTRIDGLIELIDRSTAKGVDPMKKHLRIIQNGWSFYKDRMTDSLIGKK